MYRRRSAVRLAGLASCVIAGLFVTGCEDSKQPLAPRVNMTVEDGSSSEPYLVETTYSEAEKQAGMIPEGSLNLGISANVLSAPGVSLTTTTGTGGYSVQSIPFAPEAAPGGANIVVCDDCVLYSVPLGFNFTFFGQTYNAIDISSNGIVSFGGRIGGSFTPTAIPRNDPPYNNMIALGWSDWYPAGGGSVRRETRGTPGSRKFVLQYTNVPEFPNIAGRLTAQLVLSEGSNEIRMYVTNLSLASHLYTQGIENADASEYLVFGGRSLIRTTITNDALLFSTRVNARPTITAPEDLTFSTDGGVCTRAVAEADLGAATASDDAAGYTVGSPVRSDGAALDAPYPRGSTTLTWTVTDVEGLTASDAQILTVNDNENPQIAAPADVVINTDPGQPTGTFNPSGATANDNCEGVTITPPAGGAYPIGTTTVIWTATDASGNSASAQQQVTVIDQEPPRLTIPPDFTVNATMPGGAVVSFAATGWDNSGVVTVECSPVSGSTYAIGTTTTNCTATDGSGNETRGSFTVTVLGAADQLRNLIAFVGDLPNLPSGTENSLSNQAETALRHVAENPAHVSCVKLDDFIKKLHDHKVERDVSEANIALMEADAERIKNVLGCSPIQS